MDLELNMIPMEGYACPLDTVIYQEETQESIVPDACPDIAAVLCTEAACALTRKECTEGKLECAGAVRVTVLYSPEEGAGPCRLELSIPFRAALSAPVTPECQTVVVPRITAAETRALNPRKVLCRVELAVSCQAWQPSEETLCLPSQDTEHALQQKTEELDIYAVMAVAEKTFAFTDEISLPAGQPAAEELLGHRLELRCDEAKIIGCKLIFKGEALVTCRYRTEDGGLALGRWSLPFSQIIETPEVEDEGDCTVDVTERECVLELTPGGDGRSLSLHMELLAQAVVRQSRTVQFFSDAYSITHDLTVERCTRSFAQLWEEKSVSQNLREAIDIPEGVREIKDCMIALGPCQTLREERESVMSVRGLAGILYVDDAGELRALSRPVALTARTALPEEGVCTCRCAMEGEAQAVVTATGLELRCPLVFSCLTLVCRPREVVCALSVQERQDGEEQPSVLLRMAQPGEDLWEIAKSCNTTREEIRSANDLDEDAKPEGKMLLIPRSRG